jgi:hypothetical protein
LPNTKTYQTASKNSRFFPGRQELSGGSLSKDDFSGTL